MWWWMLILKRIKTEESKKKYANKFNVTQFPLIINSRKLFIWTFSFAFSLFVTAIFLFVAFICCVFGFPLFHHLILNNYTDNSFRVQFYQLLFFSLAFCLHTLLLMLKLFSIWCSDLCVMCWNWSWMFLFWWMTYFVGFFVLLTFAPIFLSRIFLFFFLHYFWLIVYFSLL